MTFQLILFWAFAIVLIASSLAVILVRNPVHAALFLVLAFVQAAGLWMLLYAEFLALTLVLVYVGAVMVLFLFVVMMLDINLDVLREGFWGNLPLAAVIGILMAGEMVLLLMRGFGGETVVSPGAPPKGFSNTKALGQVIYTDYVFAFEVAAVILLVAIVAAIAITLRTRKETKYQDPSTQLNVRAGDRLKIIKDVK
ncbi:MAG TPA: NADH-quinone oxidoreductase subunit J [Usitatibacter sp.]|nr:NADH-quinone oxidoreductase subunit J [Usitatibacter sp.]